MKLFEFKKGMICSIFGDDDTIITEELKGKVLGYISGLVLAFNFNTFILYGEGNFIELCKNLLKQIEEIYEIPKLNIVHIVEDDVVYSYPKCLSIINISDASIFYSKPNKPLYKLVSYATAQNGEPFNFAKFF